MALFTMPVSTILSAFFVCFHVARKRFFHVYCLSNFLNNWHDFVPLDTSFHLFAMIEFLLSVLDDMIDENYGVAVQFDEDEEEVSPVLSFFL